MDNSQDKQEYEIKQHRTFQEYMKNTMEHNEAIRERVLTQLNSVQDPNPIEHKITIPIPEDVKWEAVGRGYASVLMEKQARIDRLERLIHVLYENICKGVESNVIYDDDLESHFFSEILDKVAELKNK